MTASLVGRNDGQATRSVTPGVTSRAFEIPSPVSSQGGASQTKSMTTRRVPPVTGESVPDGVCARLLPCQKPKASRLPAGEKRGVTACTSLGQPVRGTALFASVVVKRFEATGGERQFASPSVPPPCVMYMLPP